MPFKQIRKRLIEKNNLKNYVFYAIGEIVLVVIGILIALTVNNKNETQKRIQLAKSFITEIRYDIVTDTTVFGQTIRQIDTTNKYKLKWLKNNRLDTLSIYELEAIALSQYFNIKINMGAYNRMKESNIWTLQKYQELYEHISDYYNFNKAYLDNFNRWEAISHEKETDFWNNQNVFELHLYTDDSIPVFQNAAERKAQLVNILNSPKGRNYLKTGFFRNKTMQEIYQHISDEGAALLKEIESLNK